jgi:hypothetical protein
VGLAPFLFFFVVLVVRTWRAARHLPLEIAGLWAGVCIILTAACLGVVLEGPMGAVVFWTLLGLASASTADAESTPETPATDEDAKALTHEILPEAVAALPSADRSD